MLCTIEGLNEGFDSRRLAELFVRWLNNAYWTPWGEVFDVGITTKRAIVKLSTGGDPEKAGLNDEYSNGNGSLMRILPVAIRSASLSTQETVDYAHSVSSLTHRHPRSQMACGLYCLMAKALLEGLEPAEAYESAALEGRALYTDTPFASELPNFERILSGEIGRLPEDNIKSSGYVIHTLEASIWCLLNTGSYRDATLKGINLGEDTDTTGIVTGGLAGIYYGLDAPLKNG